MAAEEPSIPDADVNVQEESLPCYQCGICSGKCPASRLEKEFNPRRMVVNSNLGRTKIPAERESIWLCTGCFCCDANCPFDVKIAEIVAELRVEATEAGNLPLAIDEKKCIGCANCEYVCPEDAIKVNPGTMISEVNPTLCRSCGACAPECPVFAISYTNFPDASISGAIKESLEKLPEGEPKIVAFLCNWCAYSGAESSMKAYTNVVPVNLLCTGRVDPLHILQAFGQGADGVLVGGCAQGRCFYKWNNTKAG